MPRCNVVNCDKPPVGIHRHIGPSNKSHPMFGTTTGWEDACEEHIGTIVINTRILKATHIHRYDEPPLNRR